MVGRIAFRKYGLDDQQTSGRRNGSSAISKNRERLVVGPIVQDMREDVTIVSFRNCPKEVSFGNSATAGQSPPALWPRSLLSPFPADQTERPEAVGLPSGSS